MAIELNYVQLGQRIRRFRREAGLTQEQLAERIDMATSNISHIERATTQVSLPSLVMIANVLEVSLDQLVCDSLPAASNYLEQDVAKVLADCSPGERCFIRDVIQTMAASFWELR